MRRRLVNEEVEEAGTSGSRAAAAVAEEEAGTDAMRSFLGADVAVLGGSAAAAGTAAERRLVVAAAEKDGTEAAAAVVVDPGTTEDLGAAAVFVEDPLLDTAKDLDLEPEHLSSKSVPRASREE